MKQKYKKILIVDLCSRTPYRVKVSLIHKGEILIGTLDAVYPTDDRVIVDNLSKAIAPIDVRVGGFLIDRDKVKPYLRPMSSMTEKEEEEYESLVAWHESYEIVDWLNAHHFDYRGLIPLGLAIDVTTLEDNPYNDEFIY